MEGVRTISPHFGEHEVECRCGCGFLIVVPELLDAMEICRALAQKPIHVNSWCRCKKHNAKVGGEPNSQHLRGLAVDWWIDKFSPEMLYALARSVSAFRYGGIGLYDTFIHTDVRKNGARRWGPQWKPGLAGEKDE